MQKVPSLNPRVVTGVLRPWEFCAELDQFIELARGTGYFNFQGFSRSKIPNIFQGFFINGSFTLSWQQSQHLVHLAYKRFFHFLEWYLCLDFYLWKNYFRKIINNVYYPTSLIKKLVQNETEQIVRSLLATTWKF